MGASKYTDTSIAIQDVIIPIRVHFERRKNARFAFGKNHVHVRIPLGISKKQAEEVHQKAQKWIRAQVEQAPRLLNKYRIPHFEHGDRIEILDDTLTIEIQSSENKAATGSIIDLNTIRLVIPTHYSSRSRAESGLYILERLIAHRYRFWLSKRVEELNTRHFGFEVGQVKWKAMKSRWGSCHTGTGNIHLAVRLLLAPLSVIDSVIIHELAHIKHPDHSSAFWDTVYQACTDYADHDRWLKEHGDNLIFSPIKGQVDTTSTATTSQETSSSPEPRSKSAATPPQGRQLDLFDMV